MTAAGATCGTQGDVARLWAQLDDLNALEAEVAAELAGIQRTIRRCWRLLTQRLAAVDALEEVEAIAAD